MARIWMKPSGGNSTDLTAVTATAADVLQGKVIIGANGKPLTGNMANKGAWNGSVAMNGTVTIPAGYHNGSGKVKGPAITNRGNYGGAGNSRGNDASGQRMWVKVPGGYYNENAQVFLNWADIRSMAGLTPDKIKKDVSIMGITGTYVGEIPETYYIWTGSTWSIKNPGMTLTWADNSGGKIPYSAYASDTKGPSIDRYYNYRGNNYTAGGCARINHVFNLTPYKYLKFEKISSGTYDFPIFVGLSTNSNLQGNSYAAQFTGKFGKGVYSIDISKLSGNYYILVLAPTLLIIKNSNKYLLQTDYI